MKLEKLIILPLKVKAATAVDSAKASGGSHGWLHSGFKSTISR